MKKIFFIMTCLLATIALNAQKVVNNPYVAEASHKNLLLEQVELNDTTTLLHFLISSDPNKFWSINPESYIQVDDQSDRLRILRAEGVELGRRMYTQNGFSRFALVFPAVPQSTQSISFLESDCASCYKMIGIDLNRDGAAPLSTTATVGSPAVENSNIRSNTYEAVNTQSEQSSVSFDGDSYGVSFFWQKKANDPHWDGIGIAAAGLSGLSGASLKPSMSYSITANLLSVPKPLSHHWLAYTGVGVDWTFCLPITRPCRCSKRTMARM